MLSINNLSMHFTGKPLFSNISFTVSPQERIGLAGKNGAGKSTLLKIIAGHLQPELGNVGKSSGYSIGYLPQDVASTFTKSVLDETLNAFAELLDLEENIQRFTTELEVRQDYESEEFMEIVEKLTDDNDAFVRGGGLTMRGETEKILVGLGFSEEEIQRPASEFSGGWQMRIELAKILLSRPDCILLDEPTNHLDIESIQWFEQFLRNYDGCVILVSHDKVFLDKTTNRTIEIASGKIEDYPASYTRYREMRAERKKLQESAVKNQQREIQQQEDFIERFRYKASFASRVQSRVKVLDKIDRLDVDLDDDKTIVMRFPLVPRSGQIVMQVRNLFKRYSEKNILKDVDFALERGEKVAFVGRNGEGKTTLGKILAGVESASEGIVEVGHNVASGYYAQHHAEHLHSDSTVFDIMETATMGEMRPQIRNILGAFLFSGSEVEKKVKVLSGGEKSRLALATLLVQPSNFLILDEPTNHLDMRAKDVLKEAIVNYGGAVIVISHDRDFLEGLTTKVIEFRGGKLREYPGDITEFLRVRQVESMREIEMADKDSHKKNANPVQAVRREDKKQTEKDTVKKEIVKKEKMIALLETEIAFLEKEISSIEIVLSDEKLFSNPVKYKEISEEHSSLQQKISNKMKEWEQLGEECEDMRIL